MSKIFNRALTIGGEVQKVGTPTVTIYELDGADDVTRASGATVPSDSDAGYAKGCYFIQTDGVVGTSVYINEGTAASADFNSVPSGSSGSGTDTLNSAYENGRTIEVDTGAITLSDAHATNNTLHVDKTGTGSGNILDFKFENAHTGTGFYLDMDDGIAAVGIHIDSGGTARTGDDLRFTDDSTGAHSILNINKSGSGATIGLDYQESYNGSSASFVIKATLDNSDGLDTTVLQAVRGTGIHTSPVVDINDASTGSASVFDLDFTGIYTGDMFNFATTAACTGNVFFLDLDNAVAMTGLHMEGSGVRTQPFVELFSDCTGSASYVDINITGAGSGKVVDIVMSTTSTGDVLYCDMDAAVGAKFLDLDFGAGIRTVDAITVTADGSGNKGLLLVTESNTGSGHLVDINVTGIGSGNVLDITYSAADTGDALKVVMADNVAGGALVITGAGARTDSLIDVVSAETGSMDGIALLSTSGVFTGHILTVSSAGAATTGGLVHLNLDAGVAYKALTIDLAGARTVEIMLVTMDGTFGATAGGTFLNLDVSMTGASASPLFDIDLSDIYTGNIFDFATNSASTGTIFEINMTNAVAAKLATYTLAGIRTADAITIADSSAGAVDVIQITSTSTSSGHIINIDVDSVFTGNVIDIAFGTSAATGEALKVVMGTNLAGSAVVLTGTGSRTDDLIKIDDDSTGNAHIFDINLTGVYTGNVLDITFATAAATGEAISLAMGTNVAGRALYISSAGTGVSDEGNAIDIAHTGILVAGADVVSIVATGAISSTSNLLYLATIGDAGAYALKINATGSAEALHVDAGTVTFDETLTVTGTTTLGAVVYTSLNDGTTTLAATALELNRWTDTSGRLVAGGAALSATIALHDGKVIALDTAAGTTITLPAATGSGAIFRFLVTVLATSNSHVIKVANANDIIQGVVMTVSTGDSPDLAQPWITAATDDTITLDRTTTGSAVTRGEWFELIDGLANVWFVRGMTHSSGTEATPFSATV